MLRELKIHWKIVCVWKIGCLWTVNFLVWCRGRNNSLPLTLYLSCSIIIIIIIVVIIIIIILLLLIYHHLLLSGGGVLAHTILGVDFNDQTGDIRWDWVTIKHCQKIHQKNQLNPKKACKNCCFSSLHCHWRCCSRRDICASAREIPYWWHKSMFMIKSSCHGVPNVNLFDFMFLLINYGKVLCSAANELQQNSNASRKEEEEYFPWMLTVL